MFKGNISYTFILFECGSVHIKDASINLTLFKLFSFFKHNESNSRDSKTQLTHSDGGCKYLSQPRQKYKVACFGMPSVISTCDRKQATHIFEGFGSIAVPHSQHKLKNYIRYIYLKLLLK